VAEPAPTPRYRAVIASSSALARGMGHEHVGAEHLFLAIICDPVAVPTQVLAKIADIDQVRADLLALMESDEYRTPSRLIIPDEHAEG
jgi:ATP-dependent Clp protease ATP-binding subunit ClpC